MTLSTINVSLILWILASVIACALAFRFYGKSGLKFALSLTATLLIKDAISRFWGPKAEYIFVGVIVVVAIFIYVARQKNRDRHKPL